MENVHVHHVNFHHVHVHHVRIHHINVHHVNIYHIYNVHQVQCPSPSCPCPQCENVHVHLHHPKLSKMWKLMLTYNKQTNNKVNMEQSAPGRWKADICNFHISIAEIDSWLRKITITIINLMAVHPPRQNLCCSWSPSNLSHSLHSEWSYNENHYFCKNMFHKSGGLAEADRLR